MKETVITAAVGTSITSNQLCYLERHNSEIINRVGIQSLSKHPVFPQNVELVFGKGNHSCLDNFPLVPGRKITWDQNKSQNIFSVILQRQLVFYCTEFHHKSLFPLLLI